MGLPKGGTRRPLDVPALEAYANRGPETADPLVETAGVETRALRGGGWGNPAEDLRAAYRNRNPASNRLVHIGFRVAVAPPSL